MKLFKLLASAMMACVAFATTSCSMDSVISASLDAVNKQLPATVQEGVVMNSITLEGENIIYSYSIDESVMSMDAIAENAEAADAVATVQGIMAASDFHKSLIEAAAALDKNVVFSYKGSEGTEYEKVCDAAAVKAAAGK